VGFSALDAADETALVARDQVDLGPETADEVDAFGALQSGI